MQPDNLDTKDLLENKYVSGQDTLDNKLLDESQIFCKGLLVWEESQICPNYCNPRKKNF